VGVEFLDRFALDFGFEGSQGRAWAVIPLESNAHGVACREHTLQYKGRVSY